MKRARLLCFFAALLLIGAASYEALAVGGWSTESTSAQGEAAPDEHYLRGKFLINASRYREAIPHFNQVVRNEAGNADAFNYLGFAHRMLGDTRRAFDNYRRALAIDPEHRGANEYLGELYLQIGELKKAEQQLRKLEEICITGCDELGALERAITRYKARSGASES